MLVINGRHKGARVTPSGFANDFVLTNEFPTFPFRPSMLRVESEEERCYFTGPAAARAGTFWSDWRLEDDGRFVSTKPRRGRR